MKQSIGKQTQTAYYIHISQLSLLVEDAQVAIIKGFEQAELNEDSVFNVLKISHHSPIEQIYVLQHDTRWT